MPKVLLLSYDAETRPARQRYFEEAGFAVAAEEPSWPGCYERAQKLQPDVIAVDCAHLPSHCRESAESLRTSAATRDVPVVLFRVADHDIERTRLKVPGGVVAYEYELIDRLRSAALTRLANQAVEESAAARAEEERKLARRARSASQVGSAKRSTIKAARSRSASRAKKPAPKKAGSKKPAQKKPAARKKR